MKTLKGWENSDLEMDEYLNEPTEIDEDFYNYIGETSPPQYNSGNFSQNGEASCKIDGVLHYQTISMQNGKYFYLGILPEFPQPKETFYSLRSDF